MPRRSSALQFLSTPSGGAPLRLRACGRSPHHARMAAKKKRKKSTPKVRRKVAKKATKRAVPKRAAKRRAPARKRPAAKKRAEAKVSPMRALEEKRIRKSLGI